MFIREYISLMPDSMDLYVHYDIWGDTVNVASRMESGGETGKVNISQATFELIKDDPDFTFESRGKVEAKNKGLVDMYFVSRVNA